MISSNKQKFWGAIFVVIAGVGLLFSVSGIAATWIIRPEIESAFSSVVDSLRNNLVLVDDGFNLLDQTLIDVIANLDTIELAFESVNSTIDAVSLSLETSGDLIGDDVRKTVIDTQTALDSSASSAELIDNTLTFLSKVPLLGVDYEPEVPLHISLTTISGNLEEFPETLEEIEAGINETTEGLRTFKGNIEDLTTQVVNFKTDLEDTQTVIGDIDDSITELDNILKNLQGKFNRILLYFSLFLTGILYWIGFAQLIGVKQGLDMIRSDKILVNLSDIQEKQ